MMEVDGRSEYRNTCERLLRLLTNDILGKMHWHRDALDRSLPCMEIAGPRLMVTHT